MSDYILSCCTTADLTAEHFSRRNIRYVFSHFSVNGRQYPDDLGVSYPFDQFYEDMKNGADTKTSQVNVDDFLQYFTPFLEEGKDVLHITLSSGLSGAYNSACVAADMLKEKYPDRRILIVDSLGASSGYGLLMDALADQRDQGKTMDEVYQWALDNRLRVHHWFFSTDLTFYVKGGRISKASGFFGTALQICPLLNMDRPGHLVPREKIRTKKKVIPRIVEHMVAHAQDGARYSGKCYICHSACLDDARAVADLVEKNFPQLQGKIEIYSIGTTIGSHTGPGTVALFFFGDERV